MLLVVVRFLCSHASKTYKNTNKNNKGLSQTIPNKTLNKDVVKLLFLLLDAMIRDYIHLCVNIGYYI